MLEVLPVFYDRGSDAFLNNFISGVVKFYQKYRSPLEILDAIRITYSKFIT
jgi:hypothetical protein